ncbi:DUF3450 domain-containing protein [Chitinophaga japonensis]|uniref:BZIP transcription factor n=1 Tax=Chitinophaga japonensis TaxID=104662 RepID=A0A562T885_CHIJA|nr:DUF3450 domain-containing protein [Chitinophaga japonensis]TWI89344.1 hypothetical protein LX66_3441 [Chitinophaga japonensis]
MNARFLLSLACMLPLFATNSFAQYINNQSTAAQSATAWITGEYRTNTAFRLTRDGANFIQTGFIMRNAAQDKGVNLQLTGDAVPGLGIWIVSSAGIWNERMRITESGNVGIGTTSPAFPLHISNNTINGVTVQNTGSPSPDAGSFFRAYSTGLPFATGQRFGGLIFGNNPSGSTSYYTAAKIEANAGSSWTEGSSHPSYMTFFTTSIGAVAATEKIRITPSGNVGIGTTITGEYKLAVEGTIGARKMKVTQAAWADFVFRPDYKLPTLQEVEQFVNEHQHLPDVPSEKEVAENGLDLGEMNKKLLQKVEELTLYLIQQQKLNEAQSKRIAALEEVIKNIKSK